MKNLVLIGMPGSGKSTFGSLAALNLDRKFVDIDSLIEKREHKKITEIFERRGEKSFRDLESSVILEVSRYSNLVISTGGGSILREKNIMNLKDNGILVFINRPVENIASDLDISSRPLFKGEENKLYTLYKDRIDLYKKYGDYEILNDDNIEIVLGKILQCCKD